MGYFLDIAYRVLKEHKKPLTSREITSIALQNGWLKTKGKTPWQTMKSKLSFDILKNKDKSVFKRTDKGLFALRDWDEKEYIADRFQKALLEEDIVVFPSSSLTKYIAGPGLHLSRLENSHQLLKECYYMKRSMAESDFNVIQIVSVFLVHYQDKILTYKRTKRLPEGRLHGCYSIFFGGHLNPKDLPPLFDIFKPENYNYLLRELGEELILSKGAMSEIKYKGLLYDDSQEVSKQHLGIVYDVILNQINYDIGERGFLIDPKFETPHEIMSRIKDFENWSVLLAKFETQIENVR